MFRPTTQLGSLLVLVFMALQGAQAQAVIDNVDDLYAAALAGGSYALAAGVYELPETLVIDAPFELVGAGVATTLLAVGHTPVGIGVGVGDRVRLAGMSIVGSVDGGDILHVIDGRLELEDCALSSAVRTEITRNDVSHTFGTALYVIGNTSVTVDNCAFIENGLTAIEAGDTSRVEIRNSYFHSNAWGVYAEDTANVVLSGNEFLGNTANAVQLRGEVVATVEGNVFDGNGSYAADPTQRLDGLRFLANARVMFRGNEVRNSPTAALAVEAGARVEASNNLFEGNGGYYEDSDLTYQAILLAGTASLVMHEDVIRNNPGGAFEVYERARLELDAVTVEGNSSWTHTYVVDESVLVVTGSYFLRNEGTMYLDDEATATISNSEFSGSQDHGLGATGSAVVNVSGSLFSDNALVGVGFYQDASGSLTSSTLTNNGTGLVLEAEQQPHLDANVFTGNSVDVGP